MCLEVMHAPTVERAGPETMWSYRIQKWARSAPRQQVMIVLGEQLWEVTGMNVSVIARSVKTMNSEELHGKAIRNRMVSLMQRIHDELEIYASICGRNMAAEQNNCGRLET